MGFLSKIYERRGKAQRQAGIRGFMNGAGDVSGKGTGATRGGSLSDTPGSSSPAARVFRPARDASGPASAAPRDPQPKPRPTSRSRARSKPDPFDFETSRDAAVEEPPVSPATRSPPSGKPKPKPASRGGSPSPSNQNKPGTNASRSSGTASASSPGSAGTFGAARDAVPSPRETPEGPRGRGAAGAAADPFLPTPGKRRRVTFAEVDAFTLDEEEEEEDVDVPARGRRDCDPFDFPEDGDAPRAEERTRGGSAKKKAAERVTPPETTTTTTTTTTTSPKSPGSRPAWGVFGGSPATSPEAKQKRTTPVFGGGETVAASGVAAPSPEWARRAPASSRSPSASPMDADAPRAGGTRTGARPASDLLNNSPRYSPSAAMAMASPSPPPRAGDKHSGRDDALPESGDALAALDEAQYALSGLGADQPESGRLACASSLVAIAADARFRRALAQHGLAPRLCRAALDLCASVVFGEAKTARAEADDGVIARALAAERRKATSPALGLSAAALLYLSTLELRAGEAAAAYAGRDVAGILAGLMRAADFSAEEDASGGVGGTNPRRREGARGGARRALLDRVSEAEEANDANEVNRANAASASRGFGALLADGAEAKALRVTRDALKSLKFLPHEAADAPTLALLAAHRALAQTERAAARASQREARRRIQAEKHDGGLGNSDDRDDRDDGEAKDFAGASLRAEAEGDEAAILGWSDFKASLAARGAVLETARLADEAAREICEAGARCFSRRDAVGDPDAAEDAEAQTRRGNGADEDDASAANAVAESARASRAMARLFRCMRVVEAATFGSPPCADACVSGSLAAPERAPEVSPGRALSVRGEGGRKPSFFALVPMRVNDAVASPAPRAKTRGGAASAAETVYPYTGAERALADVVRDTRVNGIELSPCASPDRKPREAREAPAPRGAAEEDGGGSAGAKRRATEEEDEAATAKRFRTAEALLLTPSPGSKRSFAGGARAGAVAGAIDAAAGAVPERGGGGGGGDATGAPSSAPSRSRRARGATRTSHDVSPANGTEARSPAADAETPTFNFSRVAAAVDASIAWLDDDKAGVSGKTSNGPDGPERGRTMVHALLGAIPTLAAAAATAAHAVAAGGAVCGVRTARAGGLGADPRLAAGTLRAAVCVLTNLTNENPAGCAAVRAYPGGLETAAALVPWCAALEGLLPGAGPDAAARAAAAARAGETNATYRSSRRRGGEAGHGGEGGEGHDMLNAALCFLVNVAETDADARRVLRALEADAGAMEAYAAAPSFDSEKKRSSRSSSAKKKKHTATVAALRSRHVGLVELLARVFVRAGGAGPTDPREGTLAASLATGDDAKDDDVSNGEVTAEMLEPTLVAAREGSRDEQGDGLITQAYAALLVAFLVEGQPALRADVRSALPEDGFAALAGVLERFRAFHEQLESISEESQASLTRVIRWLRGT